MKMEIIKFLDRYIGIPLCYLLYLPCFFRRKKEVNEFNNLMVIKLSGFGNLILTLPAIKAIKKRFPNSKLFYLTDSANKGFLEGISEIDEVIYLKVSYTLPYDLLKLILKLRKKKLDLIIDFEQFARISAIISYLSTPKKSIGFDTEGQGRGILYNRRVEYNNNQHMVKTFYDVLMPLGITKGDYSFAKMGYSIQDEEKIKGILSQTKKKVIYIHPGVGKNVPERKWSKEKFALLADSLIEKYDATVYFTGVKEENELIGDIIGRMKNRAFNLAGMLTLKQLSLLIGKGDLLVTNDTGPLHLASFNQIPSISFFGPNTPKLYGPIGNKHIVMYHELPCSPCITNFNEKSTNCKHFRCLGGIEVREVLEKLSEDEKII